MLRRWISATDAAPTPIFATRARISGTSSSRCCRVSTFESRTARIRRTSGVTRHAAATTGPASVAIPTSSTPTTRSSPSAQRRFSALRDGTAISSTDRRVAGQGSAALFAQSRGFADPVAQEIQGRAAGVSVLHELDLLDARRVHEERALHADPARDPPYGDLTIEPSVAHAKNDPLEVRSEEHTSELQSRGHLVCRLLLEKKKE